MKISKPFGVRAGLMMTTALGVMTAAQTAMAADTATTTADATSSQDIVVTVAKTTRSTVSLSASEIQKILPGVSPLKAIESLPGVLFETADPWGNNEQNELLFIHGFSTQQLGFTLDGVPLGDQQYGNYNGLSPSRAVTSENVSRVSLSSGAGDLATASTSNLGGAIETYSSDPLSHFGGTLAETLGSYDTTRTFLRLDTGNFGDGNTAYVSVLHHDAKAWDFDGHQIDNQLNAKFVHNDARGKLTAFIDYSYKVEPNEDSIAIGATGAAVPYTRPYLYPNYTAALAYLNPTTSSNPGAPPSAAGSNFSNYFSAAQREDILTYVKYDWNLTSDMTWSNQAYYHYDYGRGIVAGPVNQAGLPALFNAYYPQLVVSGNVAQTDRNEIAQFGGTGYAVRTTEYLIDRGGLVSDFKWRLGAHDIEVGGWWEHDYSTTNRVWYPMSNANNDLTPYDTPTGGNFTQYASHIDNNVVVFHAQDSWHVVPSLLVQYGFKSSLQFAYGDFPIEQVNPAGTANPTVYPSGGIDTREWFLPELGATYDLTANEQLFANVQENMRQFITYGAGGLSPWSLGSQAAFNAFKADTNPEKAWEYEGGVRTHRNFDWGFVSGFDGQLTVYHVNFSNRLLQISSAPAINSYAVSGAAIIANVGSVTTNGADLAGTLHFGKNLSFYDAVSYNRSTYDDNYLNGSSSGATTLVPTAGKAVPASPEWMNKAVLSYTAGRFDAQVSSDYIGKRYATYLNDLSVKQNLLFGLEAGYKLPIASGNFLQSTKISLNVTNLTNQKGVSTVVVGANSGSYAAYPIPPREFYVNLTAKF